MFQNPSGGGGRGEESTFLGNCTHGSKTTGFQHFGNPTIQLKFQHFSLKYFSIDYGGLSKALKNLKRLSKNESCSQTLVIQVLIFLDPKICGKSFQVLPK